MPYSVILVDDEKLVLNSLALGFDWSSTDFEVIAAFQDSEEAMKQIRILKPDLIFTDIRMPGLSGLDMMAALKKDVPSSKFVFISGHEDFSYAKRALSLGASGYCLKPLEDDEIFELLHRIKMQLEDTQNSLEALFYSMLQTGSEKSLQQFHRTFLDIQIHSQVYCIAASIQDISSELQGFIPFSKIKYEKNTYFYFIADTSFLELPGLTFRLRHAIAKKHILNFAYLEMSADKDLLKEIELLLNSVYSFFFRGLTIPQTYAVSDNVPSAPSPFFKSLEAVYCKDSLVELMELLKNYQTEYPEKDRSITDAQGIYNLIMSALFRKDNSYFDVAFTSPVQLTSAFKDLNDMISYLLNTISERNSSYQMPNLDMIKNDTFKQILNYVGQNFTSQISFQKICKDYFINPSYLSQIFQRELGTTFTNYLTDLRINYAKDLLEHTNLIISEISEKVGYDQYFYFSKIFKKYTLQSPTQYRESVQRKRKE